MKRIRWISTLCAGLLLPAGGAAGQQSGVPDAGKAAKPNKAVPRESCVTAECHPAIKKHEVVHGPVNVNACDACHTVVSEAEHTFKPTRDRSAMCAFCHDVDTNDAVIVHKPLADGDCVACHDAHGGANRYLLKARTASELCKNCHQDVIGNKPAVHGPVAAGACSACHAPHASKFPKLLSAKGPELCVQCHVTTKAQIEKMRVVHGPVATDCQACHDAHASDHKMMLKREPRALCESCHEDIKHTVETAKSTHEAVTTERACLNCHEPHASDSPGVLRTSMVDLCFECHDREIDLGDGHKLGDIKAVLSTGKSLHGPVAQNNCAACHLIHGGPHFRLLIKEYPPEFYAPFKEESYALCFNCHERQLVHDQKTTSLTDFRNGDTNLHYLHVNKQTKGRTCRACHETHASNKEKHIRDAVPFGTGGWMLPINYQKTEAGGKCAPGCHLPYEYNRVQPVVYRQPEKPAIWPTEAKPTSAAPADPPSAATRPATLGPVFPDAKGKKS